MPKADIGDAEIYYEIHGDGPPLMLVPGLGGGGAFWAKQLPAFSRHFRCVIHDHRGAGQSSHSRIAYSVEQMASDAMKLMDKLGLESAHYVGHSTGGAMGQVIAQDHPERLRSLVLSATWGGKDAYFRRCFETRREVLQKLGLDAWGRASMLVLAPPWWIAANDASVADMANALAASKSPVEIMLSRIDAIMNFDRRDRLGRIRTPTLVVVARDDLVAPLHLTDELAQKIPGAKKIVLERGGHFVPILLPDDYNAAVLGFLRERITRPSGRAPSPSPP